MSMVILRQAQSMITKEYNKYHTRHPIEDLVMQARAAHAIQPRNQSQSYSEVSTKYRSRYHLEPPAGFDKWYGYASRHNTPYHWWIRHDVWRYLTFSQT